MIDEYCPSVEPAVLKQKQELPLSSGLLTLILSPSGPFSTDA